MNLYSGLIIKESERERENGIERGHEDEGWIQFNTRRYVIHFKRLFKNN